MARAANSWRMLISEPGRFSRWKQTMLVLSCPVRGGNAVAEDHEPRRVLGVILDLLGDHARPFSSAARWVPIAASPFERDRATRSTAPAVEFAASTGTRGSRRRSHWRHWPLA